MDMETVRRICGYYLGSEVREFRPYGGGHINSTFLVTSSDGRRFILQKINERVFKDVDSLMDNIMRVTSHLRSKTDDSRRVMNVEKTLEGKSYIREENACWRLIDYVEDSFCLERPRSCEDFRESAVGFGTFQQMLSDFPAESLNVTIPDFHNTLNRYQQFRKAVSEDKVGRAGLVAREIDFVLSIEEEATKLVRLQSEGVFPLRVTHNDTKLNNILFDRKTGKALCVIDLDTVMPGLCMNDFGDAIRFGASTADEDERDIEKVWLDMEMFTAFTEGFISACQAMTKEERDFLPLGALTMTAENGMRFLTDYLEGDIYYMTSRENQNLDRARTQFKLVTDMKRKWSYMNKVVMQ